MSKTERVLEAFKKGEELTTSQISARWKIVNPRDVVYNLRRQGYPIYLNEKKNSRGEISMKYRLGTPSRRIVAAGYKAMALGLA